MKPWVAWSQPWWKYYTKEIDKYYKSAPLPPTPAAPHLTRDKSQSPYSPQKGLPSSMTIHSSVLILTLLLLLEHVKCAPTSDRAFALAVCTPLCPAPQPQVWNIPLNSYKACSLTHFLLYSTLRVGVSAFPIFFLKYKTSPSPCLYPLILDLFPS